jgi:UDPglucose 6-dehydrogenase
LVSGAWLLNQIRYSSAISLVKLLAKKVKTIRVYEPIAYKNAFDELKDFSNIIFVKTPEAAIANSDSLVIATEYTEFWNYPEENLLQLRDKCIFDGRNILDKEKIESVGIKYVGVGR